MKDNKQTYNKKIYIDFRKTLIYFQSCFYYNFMPAHSFRMHSTTQAYNQAIQSFLTPDINKCYEQRATTSTTMQLSDMTKSMIGLRSLSFKSAKEYILCIPSLYYTLLVMLSWVKEQMWMEKKSYKISSIIRHFNEHYISQLSMLIRRSVGWVNQTESKATWSKFHGESSDNLFIFITVATQCFICQILMKYLFRENESSFPMSSKIHFKLKFRTLAWVRKTLDCNVNRSDEFFNFYILTNGAVLTQGRSLTILVFLN